MYNRLENMRGLTTDPEQMKEFIDSTRKQNSIKRRNYLYNERKVPTFINDTVDHYTNSSNYLTMGNDSQTQDSFIEYSNSNTNSAKYLQPDITVTFSQNQINEFDVEGSPTQYSNSNSNLRRRCHQSQQRVKINSNNSMEFAEVPGREDYIERINSLEKERRSNLCFNGSTYPNINVINYVMLKSDLPTQDNSNIDYSITNINSGKYLQPDLPVNFDPTQINEFGILNKQDFVERGYSRDNERRNVMFSNNPTERYIESDISTDSYLKNEISLEPYTQNEIMADSYIDKNILTKPYTEKNNNAMMKNDLINKDKFTQSSDYNLKLGQLRNEKITHAVIPPQHDKTSSACKEKNTCLPNLPKYYTELVPKVGRSRTPNPLDYPNRKEKIVYNRPSTVHNGCKYTRSQNFSSEHQTRHERLSDISNMKKNKDNIRENITSFINQVQEESPFKIGKTYTTRSQNVDTQIELKLKNKKPNAVNSGIKSETEPIKNYSSRPKLNQDNNQEVKLRRSRTILKNQPSAINSNLINKVSTLNTRSDNNLNKLKQREEIYKTPDDTLPEIKFEPAQVYKSELNSNENKVQLTDLNKHNSPSNNSSSNLNKKYLTQKESENKIKAYNEAINYTQYLIQKLSEKNIREEEKINLKLDLCNGKSSSDEKFTQTFHLEPNKETKSLIYREKITQTIK